MIKYILTSALVMLAGLGTETVNPTIFGNEWVVDPQYCELA